MQTRFDLSAAQQALAATPELLRVWLARLPLAWLDWRERYHTWNPRDIIAHLIEGEQTDWMVRVRHILAEGAERPFQPFDRSGFERGADLNQLLEEFARLRTANLEELASLDLHPDDLDRQGVHPDLGTVTLGNLLATWVVHDQDHISQIARILARGHGEHVGPWNHPDYLGILHRLLPRDRGD